MSSAYAGYMGNVMLVDLTTETVQAYPWSDTERKEYLGGKPMAYKILYDQLTGEEDAFSEENLIVITTGPLTLSGAPSSSRYDITTVSPLTKVPASSNCGGDFGLWLKRAGYDALILSGRCSAPRWLEIRDDQFVFHDAADIWGTYTDVCQERLDKLIGGVKHGSLYIGPAGENTVRFAAVMDHTHTSGRSGIGAVFGWKNLKAITVTGTKSIPIQDAKKAAALNKKWFRRLHNHPLTGKDSRSGIPTSKPCHGCPTLCRRQFHKGADAQTDLCNRLGMDSGSAQDAVAWAYAASARGIWEQNLPSQDQLFEDIALRRSAGRELAEGSEALSRKYGFKMPKEKASSQDKYDRNEGYPAFLNAWGLNPASMSEQLRLDCMLLYLDLCEALSASGLCMFTVNALCPEILLRKPKHLRSKLIRRIATTVPRRLIPEILAIPLSRQTQSLQAVSGLKLTPGAFIGIGTRCFALEQLLSLRFGGEAEKLPRMISKEKICTPGEYFAARGWTKRGFPPAI